MEHINILTQIAMSACQGSYKNCIFQPEKHMTLKRPFPVTELVTDERKAKKRAQQRPNDSMQTYSACVENYRSDCRPKIYIVQSICGA